MNDWLARAATAEERARQLESDVYKLRQTPWRTDDPRDYRLDRLVVVVDDVAMFGTVANNCITLEVVRPDFRGFIGDNEVWPGWCWVPAP